MTEARVPGMSGITALRATRLLLAAALVFAMVFGMGPARAREPTDRMPVCEACGFRASLFADTREAFTAPVHWDPHERKVVMRNALIVVGSMALLDKPVADFVQDRRNASFERIANAFEPFGERYAAGLLLSYGLVGRFARNERARQTALDGTLSSVIAAGLVGPALKEIAGRSRPRADRGAHDFSPFSGGASFPSGHTAEAFALAASIAVNSDRRWVKGLSYGTAVMVGFARIEHDAHWLSDTVAGALIGMGVARSVHRADGLRRGLSFAASPLGDGVGFSIRKRL